jgi:hypothetical protein
MGRLFTPPAAAKIPVWQVEEYREPPVWEYVTVNAANTMFNARYGASDSINYLELTSIGTMSGTRTRSVNRTTDEASNSNYVIAGTSTAGVTGAAFGPQSGMWGVTCFANTSCLAHYYANTAEYGYHNGNDAADAIRYSSTVTPLAAKNQDYELIVRDGYLKIAPLGMVAGIHVPDPTSATATELLGKGAYVNLLTIPGFAAAVNAVNLNSGMASYNASTGILAVMFRTGTTGMDYRLHTFNIGIDKLSRDTTQAQLLALLTAAMSGSYKYTDLTFAGATRVTAQLNLTALQLFVCNDNTMWFVHTDSPETTSGTVALRAYALTTPVTSASLETSYTLTAVNAVNGAAAHYSLNSGSMYKSRHMLSHDNSYVAVYTHYSQYHSGMIGFYLPMKSAVTSTSTPYSVVSYADAAYGFSIAPSGGSEFVLSRGINKDGGGSLWFYDPAVNKNSYTCASLPNNTFNAGAYPQISSSTMYQAQFVNKVLSLDLYK